MKAQASINSACIALIVAAAALAPLTANAGPSDYRNEQFGTARYNYETSVIYQPLAGTEVERGAEQAKPRGAEGPVRADAGMENNNLRDPFAGLGGIGGAGTN